MAYGMAAVAQALRGCDLPMTARDLIEQRGNREIEYRKGRPMRLRDLPRDLDPETRFIAANDAVQADGSR